MAARHRKSGGRVPMLVGGNPKVAAEAKKQGGIGSESPTMVEGASPKPRLDRPGRKRGGRVGADMAPMSTAAKTEC